MDGAEVEEFTLGVEHPSERARSLSRGSPVGPAAARTGQPLAEVSATLDRVVGQEPDPCPGYKRSGRYRCLADAVLERNIAKPDVTDVDARPRICGIRTGTEAEY